MGAQELSNAAPIVFQLGTHSPVGLSPQHQNRTIKPAWFFTGFRPPALPESPPSLPSKKKCEAWERLSKGLLLQLR